jgi:muconolactone D-isomerase
MFRSGFGNQELEELKAQEKVRAEVLQDTGKRRHLCRVAGHYANISVIDLADHNELHAIVSALLLAPFMQIDVTPLPRHPSASDGSDCGSFNVADL